MYLFFDTETTGLPKNWNAPITDTNNWPRIVQLAYALYDVNGNKIEEGDFIVKPEGFTIPPDSARVHGITTEKAIRDGHQLIDVLTKFNSLINTSTHIVAHNISFDKKVLGAEFVRNNISNVLQQKNKICTMQKSVNYCQIPGNYGYKWPKLSELHYRLFKSDFEDAHNAMVDVTVTAKCFWEMKRLNLI